MRLQIFQEDFYILELEIPRLSENSDVINIMVSDKLYDLDTIVPGDCFKIYGQFRSYNNYSGMGNKLVLVLFAKEMELCDESVFFEDDIKPNSLFLSGYICKEPVYRTTPFGREITDLLIAVNRAYNKSDYLPCIAWGRNARFLQSAEVGQKVYITGRIQSRDYQKKLSDDATETRVAYEISVSRIAKDEPNLEFDIADSIS